ncbi:hypothetical protein P7C71_g3302, partial [Lecanoromycetidae sp. Uapishka_2]
MHHRVHQMLVILAATLFALSYAGCRNCEKGASNTSPWIGRRGLSALVKRSRPRCGTTEGVSITQTVAGGYPGKKLKPRDTTAKEVAPAPLTINKRALVDFPTDPAAQDQWMVTQVNSATNNVVPGPVNGDDINSANYFQISGRTPAKDAISIGLGKNGPDGNPVRLTGCTALIVMSEKGVYFGHFWETLSYGTNDLFQSKVIDLINNGGKDNPNVQQSLKSHKGTFKNQKGASAWILAPVPDDLENGDGTETPSDYSSYNTQIQTLVQSLTGITATITTYTPDTGDDTKALGRALYQYDPQAQAPDPKNPDDKGKAGFRFIHEYVNEGTHFFE